MFRVSTSHLSSPEPVDQAAPAALPVAAFRVAFCGPIGEAGRPAGGGYEAANRRNCDALARRGVGVVELPYPKVTARAVQRLLGYAASFVKSAAFLLIRRADYDLLHLTPLNMHFALAETLLICCARLAGKPVLLDVRAGTFVRNYHDGGSFYRRTIDRTLRLVNRVAVEGQEYMPFARQRTQAPVFYFPNYVDSPALRVAPAERHIDDKGLVHMVYFGRLVAEKGVEIALAALALLIEQGHAVDMEFIGDGPQEFMRSMQRRYAHLPVTWTASLPVHEIASRAARAHFFFFASRHDGEGHSNALNEAMSLGLVPVCSAQGFTRNVVGNAGVVLPVGAGAAHYAAAVSEIIVNQHWGMLSERASTRVRALYSEDAAVPVLIDHYRSMLAEARG